MSARFVFLALFASTPAFAVDVWIVNGDPVSQGEWPDTAAVCWGSNCGFNTVQCTGVLIAPDVVLTAGHCVQGGEPVAVMMDSSDLAGDRGEVIGVEDAWEYPNSWSTYDIGVLLLEEPAITPWRPLAAGCVLDEYLVDGAPATIVGYGAINQQGTQYSTEKRAADIQINDAECEDPSDGCNRDVSPGGELGAGGDGTDTCYGDSGGPLYLNTPYGSFVAGITSRSYDWVSVPCRDGGIYVRPDAVIDWIEDRTGRDVAETACPVDAKAGKTTEIPVSTDATAGATAWTVLTPPAYGTATVSNAGVVKVDARNDYLGLDQVVVQATLPDGTATYVVPLMIVEGGGCGCATPAAPASAWLAGVLGTLVLGRRRRA